MQHHLKMFLWGCAAEGIALRVDPSYSIVQECFPYLARRLLQDNDPRIQVFSRKWAELVSTERLPQC